MRLYPRYFFGGELSVRTSTRCTSTFGGVSMTAATASATSSALKLPGLIAAGAEKLVATPRARRRIL